MNGREFAAFILPRYNFRKDAADAILAESTFTLLNEASASGGGRVYFGERGRKSLVEFDTSQHEAAVHELFHVWWYLQEGEYINRLIECFEREADLPPGKFARVRELARVYKYGDGTWRGMWIPENGPYAGRWNHDEIAAGFASGTMGDLSLMPDCLREIYANAFHDFHIFLPVVTR